MTILALEFSSPQRSVAVFGPGGILGEVTETGVGATRALGMIEDALRQAGLEREQVHCLVLGLGPGSYTGVRAAIALAQGWQLASGVRLLGLGSAEAIAAQAQADGVESRVSVVIDAQREEFYAAGFQIDKECRHETTPLRIVSKHDVAALEESGEILVGPEVTRWFPAGKVISPRAAILGRLAQGRTDFVAGEKLEPVYLRETTFVKAPPSRLIL